jgi:Zn-finger nucleic acid-binding protein
MVPVVLTELLSDPKLPAGVAETLSDVPLVESASGYWQRAGALRAKVLAKRRKAAGAAFAEDVCQFADRESDRQADSDRAHSNQTIRRKHAVFLGEIANRS